MYIEIYGCMFISKLYVQVEWTENGMCFVKTATHKN